MVIPDPVSLKPLEVWCPRCALPTECIQAYTVPTLLFAVIGVAWNTDTIVGCPRCIRRGIYKRMCVNLLTANVLCWIVLPVHLIQLLHSTLSTHAHVPEEYAHLASERPVLPTEGKKNTASLVRIVFAVFLVLGIFCFMFFVLPRLLRSSPLPAPRPDHRIIPGYSRAVRPVPHGRLLPQPGT
jgi:hypothetical protein